jgi:quinol-cytochrome oxidoreductase complex cytochrome b subunit
MTTPGSALTGVGGFLDDRFRGARGVRTFFKKVFPDHWTFLLGEIALYSFIILLLSGTLRGGLLMRQIHHWAADLFMAAIMVHMLRVFFTGAYRKPRDVNWLIGIILFTLGMVEGLFGYALPDDLLSGTGIMPGKLQTEANVVGQPMYPYFMIKTGAFFFFVFGVLALMATFFQVNPVWLYGPYNPVSISAGSQPDFYVGFPTRTGVGVAAVALWIVGMLEGANDLIAVHLDIPLYTITWVSRFAIFLVPALAYYLTKRICLGQQRKDRDLLAKPEPAPLPAAGAVDGNGVPVPAAHGLAGRLRATANRVISESVPMPATNGHSNGHGGNGPCPRPPHRFLIPKT